MRILATIFLLIFITEFSPTRGQSNFREGYVIKNGGDTLSGFIKIRGQKRMGKECLFKENIEDNVIEYSPLDIEGYRLLNGKFYVSKKVNLNDSIQNVFLEYLINGKADLYAYQHDNDFHYFIQNEGDTIAELKNSFTESTTYKDYLHENKEYIGWLKLTFKDYPAIYPDVDKAKLEHSSLIRLTEKYHKNVCPDYECINYRKDTKNQTFIGLMTGVVFSSVNFNMEYELYPFLEEENFIFEPSFSLYILFEQKISLDFKSD